MDGSCLEYADDGLATLRGEQVEATLTLFLFNFSYIIFLQCKDLLVILVLSSSLNSKEARGFNNKPEFFVRKDRVLFIITKRLERKSSLQRVFETLKGNY